MGSICRPLSPSPSAVKLPPPPPRRCQQRQHHQRWRLFPFLLCFLAGCLLGSFPFASLDDSGLRPHHFSFDLDSYSSSSSSSNDSLSLPLSSFVNSSNSVSRLITSNHSLSLSLSSFVNSSNGNSVSPLIIVITPTYTRALQAYHLNRLGQTLRLVPPPLLWVVVETRDTTEETAEILRRTGVMYRHLTCKKWSPDPKDRGVLQRNTALKHIRHHHMDGIVYFADDDNVYSLDLFREIRQIRRFGTWPVAMLAQGKSKATLEGPVCNGSNVVGWHTNEKSKRLRRFHVDMSGFAFNSTILWDPKRWNRSNTDLILQLDTVKEGFQESTFIAQVVEDESQMEGIPEDCSRIMNWHLHLDAGALVYPSGWRVSHSLDAVLPLKQDTLPRRFLG